MCTGTRHLAWPSLAWLHRPHAPHLVAQDLYPLAVARGQVGPRREAPLYALDELVLAAVEKHAFMRTTPTRAARHVSRQRRLSEARSRSVRRPSLRACIRPACWCTWLMHWCFPARRGAHACSAGCSHQAGRHGRGRRAVSVKSKRCACAGRICSPWLVRMSDRPPAPVSALDTPERSKRGVATRMTSSHSSGQGRAGQDNRAGMHHTPHRAASQRIGERARSAAART